MRPLQLEVAVFSAADALTAQQLGADRVELNAPGSYAAGGLTPPVAELQRLPRSFAVPVHVMVRPRAGDFVYGVRDLAAMVVAVCRLKAAGVLNVLRGDAFVLGALTPDGDIDDVVCEALIAVARPFGCVFHRAFDVLAAQERSPTAATRLARLGFDAVLTAGGRGPGGCSAEPHLAELDSLCHRAPLDVIVGGGLRSHNVAAAAARLAVHARHGAVWLHTAAVRPRSPGPDGTVDHVLDPDELRAICDVLRQLPDPA